MRLIGVYLCVLALVAGCSSSKDEERSTEEQTFPSNVAGGWVWKIDNLDCPVLPGFLSGQDGDEFFNVAQNGDQLSADFIDNAGNHVTMTATISGNNVTGSFCIEEPEQVIEAVVGGPCPGSIAWLTAPDGSGLDAYDLGTGQKIRTAVIPGGIAATDRPSATPDGRFVFIGRTPTSSLYRIDTQPGGTITDLADTLPLVAPAAHCATNDRLFISDVETLGGDVDVVRVIDLETMTEIAALPVSTRAFDMVCNASGDRVYLLNPGGTIYELDVNSQGENMFNTSLLEANSLDLTPNGQTIVVVGILGMEVVDVSLTDGASQTYPFGGIDVKIAADGVNVYFSSVPAIPDVAIATFDPVYAKCFNLSSRTITAEFESDLGTVGGYGIDLCPNGEYALATLSGLTSSFFLPFLDLETDSVSDMTLDGTSLGFVLITTSEQVPTGPSPRKIVIGFSGLARFNDVDRMVDGSFQITQDNSEFASQCIGAGLEFWSFVGSERE